MVAGRTCRARTRLAARIERGFAPAEPGARSRAAFAAARWPPSAATLPRVLVELRYNPASGRGKAVRTALRFQHALTTAGHHVVLDAVRAPPVSGRTPDLLVLIGGDGTVKHALDDAIALDIPVYHVPLGNENLFAREFGMTREPARLARAIDARNIDSVDVAVVQGRSTTPAASGGAPATLRRERFAIMLSIGPDASVIHRMDSEGRSAPGHLAYIAPIAEELAHTRIVPITARVDGRLVLDSRPGLLVVANLRQYGFRVNPARHADARDALLDLVFIPATGAGALLIAGALARFGLLESWPGVVTARGRVVELDAPGGLAQVDGESLAMHGPMRLETEARALRVLCPPRVGGERAALPQASITMGR